MTYPIAVDRLDFLLNQVRAIKPLSAEREYELAVRYLDTQDREAAQELVVAHLPFVVRIAFQYRHYMIPVQDLVQEGVVGLMTAVTRFDPYKGFRLASFAVWWIKAYIKNYILKSWNLVKLGTTQAQRKLFFRMGDLGERGDGDSRSERIKNLAEELHVKEDEVIEMEARVRARDWSLNEAFAEDKDLTGIDLLQDDGPNQEDILIERENEKSVAAIAGNALESLDPRERFIVSKRIMEDSPWTLQELGDHFGTSRERVRQLEKRALGKLKNALLPHSVEGLLPA
ncbi:MAG: RNA polymerase factor sigma-32 [Pseudomonadota bacterium]